MLYVAVPLHIVAVVSGAGEDLGGYEILPGAVGIHNCLNQVFGDIVVVCKELLGVFREAVAAVAEGRVVVVGAYAGVEADSVYYRLGIQTFKFSVGVELIEIAYPQGKVGVGEEFHGFGFGAAHIEHRNVLLDCPFGYYRREVSRCLGEDGIALVVTHHYAARVEVVVEGLGLAEELRGEDYVRSDHPHRAVGKALAIGEFLAH